MAAIPIKKLSALIFLIAAAACHKNSTPGDSGNLLLHQAPTNTITFYVGDNQKSYAFLFETRDTLGHFHDTTVAQILTLNDSLLVLSFPSIEPVTTSLNGTGSTTYYPGTMIDTLKR